MKFAEVPALSLRTTDLASFIDATLFDIFYLMQQSGIKCICRLKKKKLSHKQCSIKR